MRAMVVREHGEPSVLTVEARPDPQPGAGEVRLRVRAVALNHLDLWVRRGVSGHRFPLPIIPGCDVAGIIDSIGDGVTGRSLGEPVLLAPGIGCGLCQACFCGRDHLCRAYGIFGETRDGGCAEFMVAPATHLLSIPPRLSWQEAAALPLTLLTAWHMLADRAELRPGETVLVQAGGSGVGVLSIQIARLLGARVFATVGSPEKVEAARALGADEVIEYRKVDFLEETRRLTGKRGVDVIVDHIGAETLQRDVRALAKGGRLVICGATSGSDARFDLRHLFFKSLSILGSTMGSRGELETAMRFVAQGKLRAVVDRVFAMENLPYAHAWLEERRAFGKVLVSGFGVEPASLAAQVRD